MVTNDVRDCIRSLRGNTKPKNSTEGLSIYKVFCTFYSSFTIYLGKLLTFVFSSWKCTFINLHKTSHIQYIKINTSSGGLIEFALEDRSVNYSYAIHIATVCNNACCSVSFLATSRSRPGTPRPVYNGHQSNYMWEIRHQHCTGPRVRDLNATSLQLKPELDRR